MASQTGRGLLLLLLLPLLLLLLSLLLLLLLLLLLRLLLLLLLLLPFLSVAQESKGSLALSASDFLIARLLEAATSLRSPTHLQNRFFEQKLKDAHESVPRDQATRRLYSKPWLRALQFAPASLQKALTNLTKALSKEGETIQQTFCEWPCYTRKAIAGTDPPRCSRHLPGTESARLIQRRVKDCMRRSPVAFFSISAPHKVENQFCRAHSCPQLKGILDSEYDIRL